MTRTYQSLASAGDAHAKRLDDEQVAEAHQYMAALLVAKQGYLDAATAAQAQHDAVAASIGE